MPNQNPFSSNEFHDDTYKLLQKDVAIDSISVAKEEVTKEAVLKEPEEVKHSARSLHINKTIRIVFAGTIFIIICLIILLFPTIKSFYIHNFASTHTYLTYVEEKNLSEYKLLDSISELSPSHNSYDFNMDLDLSFLLNGDNLNELFPLTISGNLHNIKTESTIQHALSLKKDEKNSLRFLLTQDNEMLTLSIPELSEHTLDLSDPELYGLISSLNLLSSEEDISYMKSAIKEYTRFFIGELKHNSTLKRSSHDSFYAPSHKINSKGFSNTSNKIDCTELKVTITYKELHKIMTSFAKKILDDTTLLEFLDSHNLMKKQDIISLLTEYLNTPFSDESEFLAEDYIVLSTFIDKNDTIIGRQFNFRETSIVYSSITKETTSNSSLLVTSPSSEFQIDFKRSDFEDHWDGNLIISYPGTTDDTYNDYVYSTNITFDNMSKTENDHTKGTISILSDQLYSCSLSIECTEKDDNQCYILKGSALLLPIFNATITAKQDNSLKLEIPNMDSVYSYEERLIYFNELLDSLSKYPVTKDLYKFFIPSNTSIEGDVEFFSNNS